MALRVCWLGLFAAIVSGSVAAQQRDDVTPERPPAPLLPEQSPGTFRADPATPEPDAATDVWIFSGELKTSRETFSGTLVAGKSESEFELKLGDGATCDGSDLKGEIGLVRLPEIACSDDRSLRALFVPQGGGELKVFGHVGSEGFMTVAHLLGTEALPQKKQTAQPRAPLGRPPGPPNGPTAPAAPQPKNGPG